MKHLRLILILFTILPLNHNSDSITCRRVCVLMKKIKIRVPEFNQEIANFVKRHKRCSTKLHEYRNVNPEQR